jgi:hypothetical protein
MANIFRLGGTGKKDILIIEVKTKGTTTEDASIWIRKYLYNDKYELKNFEETYRQHTQMPYIDSDIEIKYISGAGFYGWSVFANSKLFYESAIKNHGDFLKSWPYTSHDSCYATKINE